jgi:hypothetical protein
MVRPKTLTYQGKSLTIKEWAEKYGINEKTIYERLQRGWPIDQALTKPSKPFNPRPSRFLTYQGETLCLADWARKTGISKQLIRYRLEKGLPADQVLNPVISQIFYDVSNINRKLTVEQVKAIRSGNQTNRILAEKHGVTISAISKIRNKQRWRWVE